MQRRLPFHMLVFMLLLMVTSGTLSAQTSERCFPETGFCISGRIREFWEQNGTLPVFGFPIASQQEEQIEGKPFQVQWFERNRLELHPENARPYDVLLGRLGVDRLSQQGRDWFTFPKSTMQTGCRFFPDTAHNVCGEILTAWHANGLEFDGRRGKSEAENLALFGLPLSDAQTETIEGKEYTVQWFERARFELHPENAPPYKVLLGLLGNEVHSPAASCMDPGDTELLSQPWVLNGPAGGDAQPDSVDLPKDVLQAKDVLQVKIDIHGASFEEGSRKDESAIIIDQPERHWLVASVVAHGIRNGKSGLQTIYIPLKDFQGLGPDGAPDGTRLDLAQPYGPLHARFWNETDFVVEFSSIVACNSQSGN